GDGSWAAGVRPRTPAVCGGDPEDLQRGGDSALSPAFGAHGCTGRGRVVDRACRRRLYGRGAGANPGTEGPIGLAEGTPDRDCVGDGMRGSARSSGKQVKASEQCGSLFAY